jgi:hypothetical protein
LVRTSLSGAEHRTGRGCWPHLSGLGERILPLLKVVDAPNPPLRILFGDGPLALATQGHQSRLATWREWEPVSIAAHGR